ESGFCTKPAYTLSQAQAQGGRFAKALGCSDSDATKALACLQGKTPTELVNGAQQADPLPGGILYQERSAQTVFEPIVDGVDLTMQPRELLAKGKLADVPLLHGANADEGVLFHASVLGNVVPVADQKEYEAALGRVYEASDVAKIVAQYPVKDYASANDALSAVSGDAAFLCPARTTARLLQAQGATSYEYQFSALLDGGPIPALKGKAFHSGELPYVWGNPYALGKIAAGSEAVADAMQDAFLAFAKTGDPNAAGAASPWPAYDSKADKAMHFAATSAEVTSGVREEQCDFWDTIVPKLQP
ncbi:MAG TPA: carboxylesterase family protein, partial [Polyangiales bacterium]|nr:carboxylesterase family protein [Polyangiales bacterium]